MYVKIKGVSQFIASALLVVIVVTAGFFMSQWYTGMVKQKAEDYEKEYESLKECDKVAYGYFDPKFNISGNNYFLVYVSNKGNDDFTLIDINVFGKNGNFQKINQTYYISAGSTELIKFWINDSIINKIDLVSMSIEECDGKNIIISGEEIS